MVTDREFIAVYTRSGFIEEACLDLSLTREEIEARADHLRGQGIHLKPFGFAEPKYLPTVEEIYAEAAKLRGPSRLMVGEVKPEARAADDRTVGTRTTGRVYHKKAAY